MTWTRQTFNAVVSAFDLGDTYFPAFEAAIEGAGALGIMYDRSDESLARGPLSTYLLLAFRRYAVPEINGVPGCADDMLRDALASWGFEGYRCTDGGQVSQLVLDHHYLPDIWSSIGATAGALSDVADGSEYAEVRGLGAHAPYTNTSAKPAPIFARAAPPRGRARRLHDPRAGAHAARQRDAHALPPRRVRPASRPGVAAVSGDGGAVRPPRALLPGW